MLESIKRKPTDSPKNRQVKLPLIKSSRMLRTRLRGSVLLATRESMRAWNRDHWSPSKPLSRLRRPLQSCTRKKSKPKKMDVPLMLESIRRKPTDWPRSTQGKLPLIRPSRTPRMRLSDSALLVTRESTSPWNRDRSQIENLMRLLQLRSERL